MLEEFRRITNERTNQLSLQQEEEQEEENFLQPFSLDDLIQEYGQNSIKEMTSFDFQEFNKLMNGAILSLKGTGRWRRGIGEKEQFFIFIVWRLLECLMEGFQQY